MSAPTSPTSATSSNANVIVHSSSYTSKGSNIVINPLDYFKPSKRIPIDMVMVFPNETESEDSSCFGFIKKSNKHTLDKRGNFVKRLQDVGLVVTKSSSRNKKEIYIKLGCSFTKLCETANRLSIRLRVKKEFGGGHLPFELARMDMFQPYSSTSFFSSRVRIILIDYLIQAKAVDGGAGIRLDQAKHEGIILQCFPMHEDALRSKLMNNVVKKWYSFPLPLDQIREYFGSKIAFYFAWIEFYTLWLFGAAALGAIAFAASIISIGGSTPSIDNNFTPVYAICLMIYITFFLETWKRRNAELAYRWDTHDLVSQEIQRPQYHGEPESGIWYENEFIFFKDIKESDLPRGVTLPNVKSRYYPNSKRARKQCIGLPGLCTMVLLVLAVTLGILIFGAILRSTSDSFVTPYIPGVLNALSITTLNYIYKWIATYLTEWENHRTDTYFENQLISKIWSFVFVNSYISLFYIAYIKTWLPALAGVEDACGAASDDPLDTTNPCFRELSEQLASILIARQVFSQIIEVATPYLMFFYSRWSGLKGEDGEKHKNPGVYELSARLSPYISTQDDLQEMMVQFGYVTLFAPAFPLAPVFAIINNLIEVRTDALKLLTSHQRAFPTEQSGIGSWQTILDGISTMAVVTNTLIISITSNRIDAWFSFIPSDVRIYLVFLVEHLVLFSKYILSRVIPDRPLHVRTAIAKDSFIKALVLYREKFQDDDEEAAAATQALGEDALAEDEDPEIPPGTDHLSVSEELVSTPREAQIAASV